MKLASNETCEYHLDTSTQTLHVHWHSMHKSQLLREALTQGLDHVKKHGVKNWIADVSQVKTATRPDDQQWIAEQGPAFIAAGLQSIITVLPQSALAKLSTKGWQSKVADVNAGFVMLDVGSLDEARQAVQKLRSRRAA